MKRLTCLQVVATVFTLGWGLCPMVFAVERGKQEGKRVAREVLVRAVGIEQADSLLSQLGRMNLGTVTPSSAAGSALTLERPDGTYVLDNFARDVNGNMSGHVTVYHGTEKIADYSFGNIAIPDDNRIDFSVSVSTPDANWTENGVLIGIQSDPGTAMASISEDGGDSRLSLVSFSGLDTSDSQAASLASVTVASFPVSSAEGGVAGSPSACLVTAAVCTVVVVAIIVYIICWFVVPGLGGSCW